MDLVFVQIGLQRYAFPVQAVEEVLPLVEPTWMPAWPENALGLINVRGELLPLLDVAPILGRPPSVVHATDRIVVVAAFDRRWGVLVEGVEDVRPGRVTRNQPAAPREILDPWTLCEGLTLETAGLAVVVLSPVRLLQSLSRLEPPMSRASA